MIQLMYVRLKRATCTRERKEVFGACVVTRMENTEGNHSKIAIGHVPETLHLSVVDNGQTPS